MEEKSADALLRGELPAGTLVRIVDDDEGLLSNMAFFLKMSGFDVQTFSSAQQFLESGRSSRPGCLILDQRMPGMTGMELQEELLRRGSKLPIIFLSAHGDIPMAMRAVKKGAVDFLVKPARPGELLEAVCRAAKKSAEAAEKPRPSGPEAERVAQLTPRELEVAKMVAKGLLNKQIADALGLAVPTVKMHRGNVTKKLGVHSSVAIAQTLVKAGVLAEGEAADR
jgi:two-component system response regulator DctR